MMAAVSQRPANATGDPQPLSGSWPQALPNGLVMRKMGIADLGRLIAMHSELHELSHQQPAPFVRESEAFFADHLADAGEVWGLWETSGPETRLAGYTVLGMPTASDPANFGLDLGMTDSTQLARVAHLDGTGILPHRRGIGLQRFLTGHRLERARALGRSTVISMASPHNVYSLANLLQCGLTVQRLIQKYGAARFVLVRALAAQEAPESERHRVAVPLLAKAEDHQERLQKGRMGVALRNVGGTLSLVYAKREGEVT